eukprot:Seg4041.2 transcript_id=Seg4041.2/GoldUCD/mRNA.D3Y31 product="hypothetical protein" protein_id=Seg4041.2/GoldUCD/D3Y31
MADDNTRLVGRLTELVNTLQGSVTVRSGNDTTGMSVQESVNQLYPSVRGHPVRQIDRMNMTLPPQLPPPQHQSRSNFNPGESYALKKRTKRARLEKSSQQYQSRYKDKSVDRPMLKDLFLLPSPAANKVPRGKKREELSSKGFVSFAVQLNLNMTQAEVEGVIFSEFSNKLAKCTEPAFEFLKAVNEKLIKQDTKEWNGKVVKHMTGTGPFKFVDWLQKVGDLGDSGEPAFVIDANE